MRILIVDDDVHNRNLLAAVLNDFGDCMFASDGAEAIAAYQQAISEGVPYNLITLDIEMPNMDGHEALAAIRKHEKDRNIASEDGIVVIMISACDDDENLEKSFKEACTAYILKPVDPESLISTMKRMGILASDKGQFDPGFI